MPYFRERTFSASVFGFEYTIFQVNDPNADLGVLTEYLYDGRDQNAAPVTPLDDDLFIGRRPALNDTQDTSVLFGGIIDFHDRRTGIRLEAERRIGSNWKVVLEARAFTNVDDENISDAFRNDDSNARIRKWHKVSVRQSRRS